MGSRVYVEIEIEKTVASYFDEWNFLIPRYHLFGNVPKMLAVCVELPLVWSSAQIERE